MIRKLIVIACLLTLPVLSACSFSTASDVTPPPQMRAVSTQAVQPSATEGAALAEEPAGLEPTAVPVESTPSAADTQVAGLSAQAVNLSGQVVNLSGGETPSGLEVVLQAFLGMEIASTQSVELSADGRFAFEGLEPVDGQVYIVTVEYEGVVFGSDVIPAADLAQVSMNGISIPIYEKTTDRSGLYADRAHIFFDYVTTEQIQVVVYLLISNPTDRVVASGSPEEPVLTFSLPQDAANLQFEDSGMAERYVSVEGGFGDLMNIRPGMQQHEILFAYDLPYSKKRSLAFTFPVEVRSGTIVVPEGLQLSGDALQDSGERQMENGLVSIYSFSELPASGTLQVEISGTIPGAQPASSSTTGLAIGLGVFAAVLVLAGLWLRRRPSHETQDTGLPQQASEEVFAARPSPAGPEPETLDDLLDAIVELDQANETGGIAPDEYTARRAELKERIRLLRDR